jgi:hypothetical protein
VMDALFGIRLGDVSEVDGRVVEIQSMTLPSPS